MKKTLSSIAIILLLITLILSGCGKGAEKAVNTEAPLEIKVLDVGQGDAILIKAGGKVTLIDTGDVPMRDKLMVGLSNAGVKSIDNLILTHPHADHIGGVKDVLSTYEVKAIYDSGQVTTSKLYKDYLLLAKKKNIPIKIVSEGDTLDIGDGVNLAVLNPFKPPITGTKSDLNINSIVTRLTYGNFSMLLAADAETEAEEKMVEKYGNKLKSTILKSPHHGSNTSSSPEYLKKIAPEVVIISVGANNDYHHPHPSVLKRYQTNKYKIYRTDENGTVTILSDGKNYNIIKEKG